MGISYKTDDDGCVWATDDETDCVGYGPNKAEALKELKRELEHEHRQSKLNAEASDHELLAASEPRPSDQRDEIGCLPLLCDPARDAIIVNAFMVFPNDETKRAQFIAVLEASELLGNRTDGPSVEINAFTLAAILEAPSSTKLQHDVNERVKRGVIAGDVLSSLYLMDRFNLAKPSLNKAIYAVRQYAIAGAKFGDGTDVNVSQTLIQKYWRENAPVAHLWAAFRLNNDYPFTLHNALSAESLPEFLAVSRGICDFACTHKPSHSRAPTLAQDSVWTIPDEIQARHLNSERIPDKLLNILKTYRADG
ncbi:hypothetical protein ACS8YF_18365 [Salinisphaera sp. SWV1]|uniref:hypothetical protein n=1 Tax=Salinisphaera sp. SWV1 TaxID=3454139 RepID=UPI003F863983